MNRKLSLFDIWQDGEESHLLPGDFMGSVVCAESLDDAKRIHPNSFFTEHRYNEETGEWETSIGEEEWLPIKCKWPSPEKIHVKYLGIAKSGMSSGVVRSSCVVQFGMPRMRLCSSPDDGCLS